jgi:hypothetical protein
MKFSIKPKTEKDIYEVIVANLTSPIATIPAMIGVAVGAKYLEDKITVHKAQNKLHELQDNKSLLNTGPIIFKSPETGKFLKTDYQHLIAEQKQVISHPEKKDGYPIAYSLTLCTLLGVSYGLSKVGKYTKFLTNMGEKTYNFVHRKNPVLQPGE